MAVITKTIQLETKGETDIIDITKRLAEALRESELANGAVTIFVSGATGALTTVEFEDGLIQDLKTAFEKIAPRRDEYAHNLRWSDGNGFSHVRASLLGPSLSVPFSKGKLLLGTWQQIIFIDFDNRPRSRELVFQFIGDKK